MITVPDSLASLLLRDGDGALQWIDSFPERADGLLRRWECEVDGEIRAGAVAVVIPVRSPAGPAVLKISSPHPVSASEHRALELWKGIGAIRLLDRDAENNALLLERVDDHCLDVPTDEGIAIGGQLAARLAIAAPGDVRRLADTTDEWAQQVRDDQARAGCPLPTRVLDAALDTILALGHDTTSTLLHGDLHGGNILHADRGWVVIDPTGRAGTAAYDAITMCTYRAPGEDSIEGAAELNRRIAIFSEAAGVDQELSRCLVHARAVTALLWDLSRGAVTRSRNHALRMLIAEQLLP